MLFYTAATVGHKQSRAYLSLFYENGLVPSQEVIKEYTDAKKPYEYLSLLSDVTTQFDKSDDFSLIEFQQELQSKSIINLYISSMTDLGRKRTTVDVIEDPEY